MPATAPRCLTRKRKFELDPQTATGYSSKTPRQARSCNAKGHAATASIEPNARYEIYENHEHNMLLKAGDENSDPGESDEDVHGKRQGLVPADMAREQEPGPERDSEEDEWETEEEEEEEEEDFAGITREVIIKSLGELFGSGFLQQAERDCKPQYQGRGMKRLREIFVQSFPLKDERNEHLKILQEEDWRDLEEIFRRANIQE